MKHGLPTPRHVVPSAPPADGNSSQLGNFPSSSQDGGHPPRHQRGYPPISDEPPPYPGPPLSSQIPLEQPPPYPGSPEPSYSQQPWNGDHNAGDDAPPYHWDDDPDIYHISDADEEPPLQPAVPAELDNFQGYENVGLGIGRAIPPPHYQAPSEEHRPPETYGEAAAITKEEARDALLQFVAAHCCYGSRPAKQMVITDILQSSAFHYELETFTERRHTSREYQPYRGELVDGPINGRPPGPWQVDVQPDYLFSNHTKQIEVPHTSTVHGCFHCRSHGFVRCGRCLGRGRVRCAICRGASGRTSWVYDRGRTVPLKLPRTIQEDDQLEQFRNHYYAAKKGVLTVTKFLTPCNRQQFEHEGGVFDHLEVSLYAVSKGAHKKAKKSLKCGVCRGDGRVVCKICQGFRSLRWYIRLTVEFNNNLSDYIVSKSDMPDHLVRDVGGAILLEQTLPQVWPITYYHVREINENSMRIVNAHKNAWVDRRKLKQRQRLRAVPITVIHYKWKDTAKRFWIYGNERRVHSPDYPHQCCCGCSIL